MEISREVLQKNVTVVDKLIERGATLVWVSFGAYSLSVQVRDRESLAIAARLMKRATKSACSGNVYLDGEIEGLHVTAYGGRERVCKIVGYEEVVQPAQDAIPERIEKVPVWDCGPVLASPERETVKAS